MVRFAQIFPEEEIAWSLRLTLVDLFKSSPKGAASFAPIPQSFEYLADLPNRCDVGKIGNIPTQYWSCLRDSHIIPIAGFKIEISDADIWCRLIAAAGNTLVYICFYETERLQVLFYQVHMCCLIIVDIESSSFLIRIHNTDFIHDHVSFPPDFTDQKRQCCNIDRDLAYQKCGE
jgi:hypothetical protein